jgi:hypothetical protein
MMKANKRFVCAVAVVECVKSLFSAERTSERARENTRGVSTRRKDWGCLVTLALTFRTVHSGQSLIERGTATDLLV